MKILVLGYYHRQNLGDDQFEYVLARFFQDYQRKTQTESFELIFKNTDDLSELPTDLEIIICGGGDLTNHYFLNKIKTLTKDFEGPLYAWGIGIPYPGLIREGALDLFDYIVHRNHLDHPLLLERYGADRVFFAPDLTFLMLNQFPIFPIVNGKRATNYAKLPISTPSYQVLKNGFSKSAFQALNGGEETQSNSTNALSRFHQKLSNFRFRTGPQKVGVFLARPMYRQEDPEAYETLKENLARFLVYLAKKRVPRYIRNCLREAPEAPKYDLFLIPSCTHVAVHNKEDDRILNRELFQLIQNEFGDFPNIHLIQEKMTPEEVLPVFAQLDLSICTRFHAHVFSVMTETPFLSISYSRKVKSFLAELGLSELGYEMPVNPEFLNPNELSLSTLISKFTTLTQPSTLTTVQERLAEIVGNYSGVMQEVQVRLENLLFYRCRYQGLLHPKFAERVQQKAVEIAQALQDFVSSKATETSFSTLPIQQIVGLGGPKALVTHYQLETTSTLCQELTEIVIFKLLGFRESIFNYGLSKQILTENYQLNDSIDWILNHTSDQYKSQQEELLTNTTLFEDRKFNMLTFNHRGLEGYHRAGWPYVLKHLVQLHHPEGPIFDSYLDRTFGWDYDFNVQQKVLPFTQSWLGVFHHTPAEYYSINNLVTTFQRPQFRESLKTCQGLIVLSDYLQHWVVSRLEYLGFPDIPVIKLYHPTEFVSHLFSPTLFRENHYRKVIQIGAWLRNTYAIYALPAPKFIRKCALKGKGMDNYYPQEGYLEEIENNLLELGGVCQEEDQVADPECDRPPICRQREAYCNKWLTGLNEMIQLQHGSVQFLERVTDKDYDQLLTKNVVFINLVDVSACNTIIECIVRNTPILVNRLLAVEEYLGSEYPLYYSSFSEAYDLLNDSKKLEAGWRYLCRMDKTKFKIETFIQSLQENF